MKTTPQSGEPWYATGDAWTLTQTEWAPARNIYYETIFTQSNGYMGIRGYTEEANARLATHREGYLAGVFGEIDRPALDQISVKYPWKMLCMLTLPELFGCELVLAGESFRMGEGTVEFFSRSLNMRNGVLSRHIVWTSPAGKRTRILFERFLSSAVPHLAMQQVTLTPENWAGEASLEFVLDGDYPSYFRCGDRSMAHLPQQLMTNARIETGGHGAACLTIETRGNRHTVSVASGVSGGSCAATTPAPSMCRQKTLVLLEQSKPSGVLHGVAVVSSRDKVEPARVPSLAMEIVREALRAGYDRSLADSEVVWEQRWAASDVAIDGPARDQAYIRFSAFSMLQMAPFHTDGMSIPARAYAFNRYHGLYYWDSETFLLPNYLHTHPGVAENLLAFRFHTLDGARRTAAQLKAPGACYPWMTDSDEGNEQAPWGIGDYVWHQNADIAYAIDQYVEATGNTRFMLEKGLEVMVESARFWMSRLETDADGVVHLHDTVGPDEIDKHGKDNGYTSLLARRHFRLCARWIERLGKDYPAESRKLFQRLDLGATEIAGWSKAADRLAVPMVPGRNFPLQDEFLLAKEPMAFDSLTPDEAFAKRHTHRVVKQADIILAMYLLQDEFTVEQMRDAYDFYEPMTLHYSSLSYNTHSILATKIGRDAQAYDYFMKAAGLDLDNLKDATKDGLHAAALGGTWQTIVYGFLGLRIEGNVLTLEPRIPDAWKSIRLCLMFRGYQLQVEASHRECGIRVVELQSAGRAELSLHGDHFRLANGLNLKSAPTVTT